MSLESCPKCGYALPVSGPNCRHCVNVVISNPQFTPFDSPQTVTITMVMLGLGLFAYLLFFSVLSGGAAIPASSARTRTATATISKVPVETTER
jgi:hypothetical protein